MEGNATATNTLNVLRGKIASISPNALDTSLSVEGASAEAKATGDAIKAVKANLNDHESNKENPHGVTKKQVGLEFVDNTADMDKPVSTAQAEAIADAKKAGTDAQAALEHKVSVEEGKGLSTNDFTNEYKQKVDDLTSGGSVDYTLPIGGEEIGGVKNGGAVVIGEDGTMSLSDGAITPDMLSEDTSSLFAQPYTYGTTDLTDGAESTRPEGSLYFVYEE